MNDDVFEVLLCLLLVSGMIVIGDALMVGIRKLSGKIRYANARLIWRRVRRHRNGSIL